MKTSLIKAAELAGCHPAELVFKLSTLGAEFQDCYPEVEESWLQTVISMSPGHSTDYSVYSSAHNLYNQKADLLSDSATRILDKLERKKHFGSHSVQRDTIRNHYCPGISEFDSSIEELMNIGVLTVDTVRDVVSLNPAKGTFISDMLKAYRNTER